MYRVYDKKSQKWIEDDICMNPNGDLYKVTRLLFGCKLSYLSDERYVWHKGIGVFDKNYNEIYEGDYVKAEVDKDKIVSGIVCYADEYASYVILCNDTSEFYHIGNELSEYIEVIGNSFDEHFLEVD